MSTVDIHELAWRKSSYSGGTGTNDACVEIAFATADPWRKSSHSGSSGDNDNCVEVAFSGQAVAIRDSKNPTARLVLPAPSFATLANSVSDRHPLQ